MVKEKEPYYNLAAVHAAAKAENIEYRGRRVSVDIAELGYRLSDVAGCLLSLTRDGFHKAHHRRDGSIDDAYRVRYPRPGGDNEVDDLYVKFRLVQDCLIVDLGSFHLHR